MTEDDGNEGTKGSTNDENGRKQNKLTREPSKLRKAGKYWIEKATASSREDIGEKSYTKRTEKWCPKK